MTATVYTPWYGLQATILHLSMRPVGDSLFGLVQHRGESPERVAQEHPGWAKQLHSISLYQAGICSYPLQMDPVAY